MLEQTKKGDPCMWWVKAGQEARHGRSGKLRCTVKAGLGSNGWKWLAFVSVNYSGGTPYKQEWKHKLEREWF